MDPATLELKDIHLPGAIGWWPPSFGWWILAALLLATVALIIVYGVRWHRQRPLRTALASLDQARVSLQAGQLNDALQGVSETLRRTAITLTDGGVAGLTGRAWLSWLDSQWQRQAFSSGAGQLIVEAPYAVPGRVTREQAADLLELARAWIEAQRIRGWP